MGFAVILPDMETQPADSRLIAELGAELRLLLPIAMADGALHARERTMLERYIAARAKAAYDDAELAAALRWAQADPPTPAQCVDLVSAAVAQRADAIAVLWEMAQALSEADGMVTGVETVRLARLKQALDQAAAKGIRDA
ncbi:MAG: hypothetical protein JNM20_15180 [Rhizobiales bacterium]|nr:hypothetical protein [Hyphomicrobiales bacterium]